MKPIPAGIHKIEVPLPGSPLKSVNSYIIPGKERHLVIDTGMNRPECREAFLQGFAALNLRIEDADFFVTHFHMDHIGLAPVVSGPESTIIMGRTEAGAVEAMRDPDTFRREIAERAIPSGMPVEEMAHVLHGHPGIKYRPPEYPEFKIVDDGERLVWAEFSFVCIETPGHTPGHMCLYEPQQKIFFSGDHVLGDITPNISALYGREDPLADYLESLDKISGLEAEIVLPGHRNPFDNLFERIEELKTHHANRAREALDSLDAESLTAYEVASRLTWDISVKTWDQFPVLQKWFATGEAMAHLKYLVGLQKISCVIRNSLMLYSRE